MNTEPALQGAIAESVKAAKASFAKIDEGRLCRFIEQCADAPGQVELGTLHYPSEGAGSSNGIAFFSATIKAGEFAGHHQLVLRYSPGVQLLKQKTFEHEFFTMQAVASAGLPVPKLYWLDRDGTELGAKGYIMATVDGDPPAAAMYSKGPLANVSPEERKAMMLQAAAFHGRLRKAAIGPEQVPHLCGRGEGDTAVQRELDWWMKEVLLVNSPDDHKTLEVAALRDWLVRNEPADLYEPVLVHGDAQIANLIYANGTLAAAIDWELSYLGHNEADIALICFLTKANHVLDIAVEGTPSDAEYLAEFEAASGHKVSHWPYFQLLNAYRIVAVTSLSAHYMPQFDAVWAFHKAYMDEMWAAARLVYGE